MTAPMRNSLTWKESKQQAHVVVLTSDDKLHTYDVFSPEKKLWSTSINAKSYSIVAGDRGEYVMVNIGTHVKYVNFRGNRVNMANIQQPLVNDESQKAVYTCMDIDIGGAKFAVGSCTGTAHVFNIAGALDNPYLQRKTIATFPPGITTTCIKLRLRGDYFVGTNNGLVFYNNAAGIETQCYEGHTSSISQIIDRGNKIITASVEDGQIIVWDTNDGVETFRIRPGAFNMSYCVAFRAPNAELLYYVNKSGKLVEYNLDTKEYVSTFDLISNQSKWQPKVGISEIVKIAVLPDLRRLIIGFADGYLFVFNRETQVVESVVDLPTGLIDFDLLRTSFAA